MKSIIFDLGGVIFDIDFNETIRSFQQVTDVDIMSALRSSELNSFFYRFENGDISEAVFRNELKQRLGVTITDNQFDLCWNRTLIGVDKCKLDALLELSKHYFIYLLSNTNSIHWKYILNYFKEHYNIEFEKVFKEVYLSFELHMSKPDINLFNYVIERAGLRVTDTLFIDDKQENIEAASTLGINTFMPIMNSDWTKVLYKEYDLCR